MSREKKPRIFPMVAVTLLAQYEFSAINTKYVLMSMVPELHASTPTLPLPAAHQEVICLIVRLTSIGVIDMARFYQIFAGIK